VTENVWYDNFGRPLVDKHISLLFYILIMDSPVKTSSSLIEVCLNFLAWSYVGLD